MNDILKLIGIRMYHHYPMDLEPDEILFRSNSIGQWYTTQLYNMRIPNTSHTQLWDMRAEFHCAYCCWIVQQHSTTYSLIIKLRNEIVKQNISEAHYLRGGFISYVCIRVCVKKITELFKRLNRTRDLRLASFLPPDHFYI